MVTGISALAFISAAITIYGRKKHQKKLIYIFKPLATFFIIYIAFHASHRPVLNYEYLILAGLFFCFAGDVLLMLPDKFFEGLISFLTAHLLLIYAFILISNQFHIWLFLLFVVSTAVLYLFIFKWLGKYRTAVLFYLIAVSAMTWRTWEVFAGKPEFCSMLPAAGGVLFMISDYFNAVKRFRRSFKYEDAVILGCYYSAIWLFALYINC